MYFVVVGFFVVAWPPKVITIKVKWTLGGNGNMMLVENGQPFLKTNKKESVS